MFPNDDPQNPYSAAYDDTNENRFASQEVGDGIVPTQVSAGDVISYTSEMFKRHWGPLVGAVVVTMIISWIVSIGGALIESLLFQAPGAGQNIFAPNRAQFTPIGIAFQIIGYAVQLVLGIGATRMYLDAGRDKAPSLEQLFSGGPWFWRVLGFTILFYIAIALGAVLLIIPLFIVILMWWPGHLLIVDNKCGVLDSFTLAASITKGNWGTAILLFLAAIAIIILGILALCIGVLFASPFVSLMMVCMYLMMSGQVGRPVDSHPDDYGFNSGFES